MLDITAFHFSPAETPGLVHAENVTEEGAKTLTELLQQNNANHHIFFTTEDHMGVYLHNHIAHHDVTLWALGAKPEVLRSHHERNSLYMRGAMTICEPLVLDLADDAIFKKCLGREENFRNFEVFFLNQIKEIGYEAVLQKYLVSGGELADDMMYRIYMGYVHGIIHIGFALEFKQPVLLAEGLAQAAVHHDEWYIEYLSAAETLASKSEESPVPLSTLIHMACEDPAIKSSSSLDFHTQTRQYSGKWAMDLEIARDGVLRNARAEILRLASRWRIDPNDDLERVTAELINTAVYLTIGAQIPPHECAFDFYLLHAVNASITHLSILREPSITNCQKARLLEYSGRVFLLTYAGMGCPTPLLPYLLQHKSKLPNQTWETVFERACLHEDDGHMAKLIRSTKIAEMVSEKWNHLEEFRVKQHVFLKAAVAMIDSGSERPMTWTKHWDFVRGAGWGDAWARFPIREGAEN